MDRASAERLKARIRFPPSFVGSKGCSSAKTFLRSCRHVTALRRMPMELHRLLSACSGFESRRLHKFCGAVAQLVEQEVSSILVVAKIFAASSAKFGCARILVCAPGKQTMKRYHQEMERTTRAHRFHLRRMHHWPDHQVNCDRELQRGRFRKRKPLDCGRARCLLCHFEKLFRIPSIKDRIQQMQLAESLRDYYCS